MEWLVIIIGISLLYWKLAVFMGHCCSMSNEEYDERR